MLLLSVHTVVIALLQLYQQQIGGLLTVSYTIVSVGLAVLLIYTTLHYWSGFVGHSRKLLVQIPFIAFLLPFLLSSILFSLFQDDAEINDSDLLLQPVPVLAQEENVYYALPNLSDLPANTEEAVANAVIIVRDIKDSDLSDPKVQILTEETRSITDAFLLAIERPSYQCPTLVNNFTLEAELCRLGDIQTLALLTKLRALHEAETGATETALKTANAIVKAGQHFSHMEQPTLFDVLIGTAIQGIGLNAIERILDGVENPTDDITNQTIATLQKAEIPDT